MAAVSARDAFVVAAMPAAPIVVVAPARDLSGLIFGITETTAVADCGPKAFGRAQGHHIGRPARCDVFRPALAGGRLLAASAKSTKNIVTKESRQHHG